MIKTNLLLIAIVLLSACQMTNKEEKDSKPNIIYILADDMGFGDIEAYNKECKLPTPALNKMADEGMIFTDAHTSSSVCTPTRYGILTGRYNWRSRLKKGVLWGKDKALIPNERTTVASLLKKNGYQTAFIGKWHLGWDWALDAEGEIDYSKPITNSPNDIGFDYAYGHVASLDIPPYVYVENRMPTAIPEKVTESKLPDGGWWRKGDTAPDFVHEDVTPNFFRRAIKYVQEHANEEKPFFLYLPLPSPHTPILPTEEWKGKSGINAYGDFVMMVDDYVEQLNEAVKKAGIEDNTMIIFTTDNGCSPAANIKALEEANHFPGGPFRGHKADIYEAGHRVPFIVKWPKVVAPKSKSEEIICTTDLLATVADIVNQKLADNQGEDSYSFLPVLKQETMDQPLREATIHHSINGSFAIRQGDWKLAMCPGSGGWSYPRPGRDKMDDMPPVQLFNLKNDPGEKVNLSEQNPEKVAELQKLLTKIINDGRSTKGTIQANDGGKTWKQLWWMSEE
jgi:arylsulfatase A-like enzyme